MRAGKYADAAVPAALVTPVVLAAAAASELDPYAAEHGREGP